MTALRIFASARPSMIGAPVLPMSRVDEEFWRLRAARGIDTRRAETGTGSVHESPARKGLAQTSSSISVARLDENREQTHD